MTVKFRQEINIICDDLSYSVGTGTIDAPFANSPIVALNTNDFNDATYYLEVIFSEEVISAGLSQGIYLYDESDTRVTGAGASIPFTIDRSTITLSGDHEYRLGIYKAFSSGEYEWTIHAARIVILQSAGAITATQTQIEVGSGETNTPAALNTDEPIAYPKFWKYESAKWDPAPTFTFQACVGCDDDMETYQVALEHDGGTGGTWSGSTVGRITGISTEAPTLYEASFTPVNGYMYRMIFQGDDTKDNVYFYNAKIVATQSDAGGITKLQTNYLLANRGVQLLRYHGFQMVNTEFNPDDWGGCNNNYYNEHSGLISTDETTLYQDSPYITNDFWDGQSLEYLYDGSSDGLSQSFIAEGNRYLTNVMFSLGKQNSPTGTIVAKLYNHSGTFGTSSVPTGTALATSGTISAADLSESYTIAQFYFPSPYQLTSGNYYCITVEFTSTFSNSSNYVEVSNNQTGTHDGNMARLDGGSWTADSGEDLNFKILMRVDSNVPTIISNSNITGWRLQRSSALSMPSTEKEIGVLVE